MLCIESIQAIIQKSREDSEILSLIEECLLSFSEYHTRIYKMETWAKLHSYDNMLKEDFQTEYTDLDHARSMAHNIVISNINILNRLCHQYDIQPAYNGVVSEERPYRIEIADTILAYVDEVVNNRKR